MNVQLFLNTSDFTSLMLPKLGSVLQIYLAFCFIFGLYEQGMVENGLSAVGPPKGRPSGPLSPPPNQLH